MKKFLLAIIAVIFCQVSATAQLEDEGQIGWVQSDTKESYVSFHFISNDGRPAYVKIIGQSDYSPCYIPIDKISDFRKYLTAIYKKVSELDKDSLLVSKGNQVLPLAFKKPFNVCMSSAYKLHYKEDREIKGGCDLSVQWEYYAGEKQPAGSYVSITAAIPSAENPDGYNKFKIWVTLDEIQFILKKIISKNEIFKWENHVEMRNMEKNRNATDMNRRLRY